MKITMEPIGMVMENMVASDVYMITNNGSTDVNLSNWTIDDITNGVLTVYNRKSDDLADESSPSIEQIHKLN